MAPIIPAGGRKMDWAPNMEPVEKKAQGMFEDDPQLQAIKGLPGMQDGIDELGAMSIDEAPAATGDSMVADVACPGAMDVAPCSAPAAGGAVEQAIEKVKDAAQGVADAAIKDVEKAVTDAVKDAGKPKVEEIKPDEAHEKSETPAEEKKEEKGGEHKDGESAEKEKDEEKEKDKPDFEIPGVEGEKDGKVEKEGDKEKDDKPAFAASSTKLRRIAELAPGEVKELRHYWENLLGFPKEYVDAMLKNYKS